MITTWKSRFPSVGCAEVPSLQQRQKPKLFLKRGWDGSVRGFEALATKRGEGFGVPMLPNHGYVGLFSVSGWWFGTCEFLKLLAMMINLD